MILNWIVSSFARFMASGCMLAIAVAVSQAWFCASSSAEETSADVVETRMVEAKELARQYCFDCHNADDPAGGFDLESVSFASEQFNTPGLETTHWERALRRIATRQMPPPSEDRPNEAEYEALSTALRSGLEVHARRFPHPGDVAAMRRLTRLEYQYSIRDLLGITIDARDYLPKDESSHGFDNITVEELSPTHLNRYLSAAQSISRAAVGGQGNGPVGVTIREPADRSQENHVQGLPFGTRGGLLFTHHFHQSGEYEIELKLTRDRDEKIEGLDRKHHIDILMDRRRLHRFEVKPVKGEGDWKGNDYTNADSHLRARLRIEAGEHVVGVTFPKTFSSLTEGRRAPFDANFNRHRHPRRTPAIFQVSLVGPFNSEGSGDTTSRRLVFGKDYVSTASKREKANRQTAIQILTRLAKRAYRRPVNERDVELLLPFFDAEWNSEVAELPSGDVASDAERFERGIQAALTAILVNPNFLFRIEGQGPGEDPRHPAASGQHGVAAVRPVGDFELASRLSYFLWSSLPDARLQQLAEDGQLQDEDTLVDEVKRMLADERSHALVDNFAAQWLYLRNLESITPDLRLFPDFDDNLRHAFAGETKHLFADVLMSDRSIVDLIKTDTTFLNERLATHYGIRGVRGSAFRPVQLDAASHRGGILRHGSILMVTSYATRTSPTIRGNWILENILGTPAPPPPPNIPNLAENSPLKNVSLRQRLASHRENPACASCHDLMDPVGFALENFDAVGRWREFDGTNAIDSGGSLPDGQEANSVDAIENGILARPENFATTLTEKLMTYALGRAVRPSDGPAIRRVVVGASTDDYKLSSIIAGIVLSDPFRKRSDSE